MRTSLNRILAMALLVFLASLAALPPASPVTASPAHHVGVLVMAHGGTPEWNQAVDAAVAPLSARLPVAVAYGMADPHTLAAGLDSLRARGVSHVAVVRMFLSGESFLTQTRYLLGLSEERPDPFLLMTGHGGGGGHAEAHHRAPDPLPIAHRLTVATHDAGLIRSDHARRILVERARELSRAPEAESVLLLAHGMGGEEENGRVLSAMADVGALIAREPFHTVRHATLREDWEAERAVAEEDIRRFVAEEAGAGRRVLVVPVRLTGFGPYAEVLADYTYTEGRGLLPHPEVSDWVTETAQGVICANGWPSPLARCADSPDGGPSPR